MPATAPLFDIELLAPVAGMFVLDHSTIGSTDLIGTVPGSGFAWTSIRDDATVVETWRGADVEGLDVAVKVGTLNATTVVANGTLAATNRTPGTVVRLRAAGTHTDTLGTFTLNDSDVKERKGDNRADVAIYSTDAVDNLANTTRYGAAAPGADAEPWPARVARLMESANTPTVPPAPEPLTLTPISHAPAAEVGLWAGGPWTLTVIDGVPVYQRTTSGLSTRVLTGLTPGLIYRVELAVKSDNAELDLWLGDGWDDYDAAFAAGHFDTVRLEPANEFPAEGIATFEFIATDTTATLTVTNGAGPYGITGLTVVERQRVAWCNNIVTETNLARHLDLATASAGRGWYVDRHGVARVAEATGPTLAHFSDIHDTSDPLHVCYTDVNLTHGTADVVNDLALTNLSRRLNDQGDWENVATTLGPFVDRVSAVRWGRRAIELETCIRVPDANGPDGYTYNDGAGTYYVGGSMDYRDIPERLAMAHLERLANPRPRIAFVTFNAADYPDLVATVDLYARVTATRAGNTQPSAVISIHHIITPTKWLTTLGLIEQD